MKKTFNFFASIHFIAAIAFFNPIKAQTCPSWGPYIEGFDMANTGELWYSGSNGRQYL